MKTGHIFTGISIVLNVLFILFISSPKHTTSFQKHLPEERSQYTYLSPRIFVDKQNDLIINFTALRDKMREYEKETFVPASLLKLPLAMGVYKKIEQGKIDPEKKLLCYSLAV